jgi:protein phosphatase
MQVNPGNCQHIGARSSQQDAFGFSDKDDLAFVAHGGVLVVLADGMGGMACGGEASQSAVQTFLHRYMAKPVEESVPMALLQALDAANQAVVNLAQQVGEEVGTTLVAAVIHDEVLHWVSVGDSRLYLLRKNRLTQLTEDHVLAIALDRDAADGLISPQQAQNHPERAALTSCLGLPELDLIDQNPQPLALLAGDLVLLCSDGLYAALDEAEITACPDSDAQKLAEELVALALAKARAGQDNLTVAILASAQPQPPEPATGLI